MQNTSYIDIRNLTDEELSGVISLYPWFSGARRELCERMVRRGSEWAREVIADSTLYITDPSVLASLVRTMRGSRAGLKAKAMENAGALAETPAAQPAVPSESPAAPSSARQYERRIIVAGGDFFSRDEYEEASDSGFRSLVDSLTHRTPETPVGDVSALGHFDDSDFENKEEFYTETLAEIYVEQGYADKAKKIYSRLSLEYPEKSAYFVSLIENLNK